MNYQRQPEVDILKDNYRAPMTQLERTFCTPNTRTKMLEILLKLEKKVVGYFEEMEEKQERGQEGGGAMGDKERVTTEDEKKEEQEEMAKIVKMALTCVS